MKLKQGFTVIEILVVIAIIAVLTVVVLPSISNLRAKNRDTERVADIAAIQLALSLYKNQNPDGSYPLNLQTLLSEKYISSDSLLDPNEQEYAYVPLTRTANSDKCTYYHLGTTLDLPSGQIDSTDQFDSTDDETSQGREEMNGYYYCNGYTGDGLAPGSKNYNVRP